ncbi:hypothetical protein MKX41_17200 [Paenibacillus sp. FSL R5-0475]|uniref:hypothetical protein n=1 Tax=Paenibacillus sp. FSL R5-0475 TaxID=2921643 RepID=UPI0030F645FE
MFGLFQQYSRKKAKKITVQNITLNEILPNTKLGIKWAIEWLKSQKAKEVNSTGSLVTGLIGDISYGFWIIPRDHKDIKNPLEQVTIKKTEYNKFKENLIRVDKAFLLIPRTYRRLISEGKSEYWKDISYFVQIPHQVLVDEIVNKKPRTPTSETTINIGFSEKQIDKWEARGVLYFPFFE